jgi:hypothetical protein
MSLEALAFALVIGGQFLAAIVLISKRAQLYPDPGRPNVGEIAIDRPPPVRRGSVFHPVTRRAPNLAAGSLPTA